jgi:hypothetical protein
VPGAVGGPHATVHAQVGNLFNDPITSAADPLFYAHHANIDRLWMRWEAQNRQAAAQFDWGDLVLNYFDENGSTVAVKVPQLLQRNHWGYRYPDESAGPLPPVESIISDNSVHGGSVGDFDLARLSPAIAREGVELSFQLRVGGLDAGYYSLAVDIGGHRLPLSDFGVFSGEGHHHGPIPISAPLSQDILKAILSAWNNDGSPSAIQMLRNMAATGFPSLTVGFLYQRADRRNNTDWQKLTLVSPPEIHFRI